MAAPRRQKLLDLVIAILLAVAALALYASTLAPTVLAGDGGEFQFAPYLLGIAHPTGYPLYLLLGWLWSHLLPLGDVAYRLNLFSAFWAALAAGLLYPTARILLRQALPDLSSVARRLLAILAAATLAVTPTLWSQVVMAEVYGLHIFFFVLHFYLLLAWADRGRKAYLLLAAFSFGLALAHHSTTALLAPAIVVYVWLTDRRVFRDWRLVLQVLVLALLPLLLYLYIPLRAPHSPYLRLPLAPGRELVLYENTPANLVRFVLGGPFGGYLDLSVDLGARLSQAWGFLVGEVGWVGVLLAATGLAWLAWSRRWSLLALSGLAFLVSVAFNLVYTIGDIYVLYIPTYLVVVLWLAVGVGALALGLCKALPAGRALHRLAPVALVLVSFALPLWLAAANYADLDQNANTRARTRWEQILSEPLPDGAVLVSDDRNNIMPLWYMQYVDGTRPDLLGLFPLVTADYPTLGHILDLALSTGRPVYLIKDMPGIEVKVGVTPEGSLWRILGPAVEGEPAYPANPAGGLAVGDAVALLGHDRAPHSPQPGGELQVRLYWQALRPLEAEYHSFVHLLDGSDQAIAQSDRQPGGVYYPTTLWRPGETIGDDHVLLVPGDAAPGVYRLLVGMYALSEDGLQPLGEPVIAGQVAVKDGLGTEAGAFGHHVGASFADEIELLGYDAAREGRAPALTLVWRALQAPAADYTVFVHLLDAGGKIVAQHDGQPQAGAYPTSVWDAGEVVVDLHSLSLPEDLPPGAYTLRVGLYQPQTGRRLPLASGGDSVELAFELEE